MFDKVGPVKRDAAHLDYPDRQALSAQLAGTASKPGDIHYPQGFAVCPQGCRTLILRQATLFD